MKIVASTIVKNETGRYIEPWLDHLLSFCDEVRILDDGSCDHTREWLSAHGAEVLVNFGPAFMEFESKARNELLRWTMRGEPDYVLAIDADEFVAYPERVRAAAETGGPVFSLTMREVWTATEDDLGYRVDGLWGTRQCPILWRAPKALQGSRWQIPTRKLACGREPLGVRRSASKPTGTDVLHFGWTRQSERPARAERYFEHDRGRYHANRHLQSILDPDTLVALDHEPWPEALLPLRHRLLNVIHSERDTVCR